MTVQQMYDFIKTYIDKKISATNDALFSMLSDNKVKEVGSNIDDVKSVADNLTDINTTADSITNVNVVATNINNVNNVANNKDNVDTVANNITNVNNVGTNITNVNNVANDLTNVDKVANDIDNIDTVATSITNVNTVSANIDNVNITADSIDDVNTYAKTYLGAKTEDPTVRNDGSSLQMGDLYFNTTTSKMKVYNGTTWQLASSSVNGMVKKQTWTGDGTTTSFSVTDGYDSNYAEVYVNGVNVTQDVDLSDGQNVVFNTAPADGDEILGVFFGSFVLADCYTKTEADNTFVNKNDYEDIDVATKVENVVGELVKTTGTEVVKKDDGWIKNQCSAWVVFDGTNGTIKDSYNVDSIVRNDVGKYTINLLKTMESTNYSVVVSTDSNNSGSEQDRLFTKALNRNNASFDVALLGDGGGFYDASSIYIAIFGGKQ